MSPLEPPIARPKLKKSPRRASDISAPAVGSTSVQLPAKAGRRSRSSSSSAAAITLFVLLILAVGAYFTTEYLKNKTEREISAANEAAAIAGGQAAGQADLIGQAAPVDPTADWKAFNLSAISTSSPASTSLSFKYPAELQLTQNSNNLILSNPETTSTQLNINWVKSAKTLTEYLAALDKLNETGWEGQPSVEVATSTAAAVISGYPVIFRQQKLLAADLDQFIVYVKTSDTLYAISLTASGLNQDLLNFFVTFLNNFKFAQ